jgi:hypothetical protein
MPGVGGQLALGLFQADVADTSLFAAKLKTVQTRIQPARRKQFVMLAAARSGSGSRKSGQMARCA